MTSAISNAINNFIGGSLQEGYMSWQPRWGANTVNASISGLLAALSGSIGIFTASSVYDRYKQQEQIYLDNAEENARRLQLKGDIALRNLRTKHALSQGSNELSAAAAGGRLSGSTLDVLVSEHKYNVADERTQALETIWEVSEAKRAGYLNALNTAWASMQFANTQKASAIQGLVKGLQVASSSLLADKRSYRELDYLTDKSYKDQDLKWQEKFSLFGFSEDGTDNPLKIEDSDLSGYPDNNVGLIDPFKVGTTGII